MSTKTDCDDNTPEFHVLAWALEAYVAFLPLVFLCVSQRRRTAHLLVRITLWVIIWLSDDISSNLQGWLPSTTVYLDKEGNHWIDLKYFWYAHLLMLSSLSVNPADSLHEKHGWLSYLGSYLLTVTNIVYSCVGDFESWSSRPMGTIPVMVLSVLSLLRIWQVIAACRRVEASSGLGKNAKRVADHMEYEHDLASVGENAAAGDNSTVRDPVDLRGYHYLVLGEEDQPLVPEGRYRWRVDSTEGRVVTVDRVWRCPGKLLNEGREGRRQERQRPLKDLCLSFALCKLLSRRLAGFKSAESGLPKTREFLLSRLLGPSQPPQGERAERAFRVVEKELAFLYDSMYTRLPVFFANRRMLAVYALLSLVVAGSYAAAARRVFSATHRVLVSVEDTTKRVDFLIQYVLASMAAVVAIVTEIWQLIDYLTSDWGKVVLLCAYVRKPHWQGSRYAEKALGFVCRLPRQKPWQRKIGQYSLLCPARCICLRGACCCDAARKKVVAWKGKARTARVQLPRKVKEEVLRALKRVVDDRDSEGPLITNGKSILKVEGAPHDELSSCRAFDFETDSHTHTILVWHVATTLCDLAAAASSPQTGAHRNVVSCLSKYCAYLAACAPKLLPDAPYTNKFLVEAAVSEADNLTKNCRTTDSMYHLLLLMGSEASAGNTIMATGAKLGRVLVQNMAEELRWRVLVDFWTEMLLYIAQADHRDMAEVHAQYLAKGGEFVTHIWAFLCHTGVLQESDGCIN